MFYSTYPGKFIRDRQYCCTGLLLSVVIVTLPLRVSDWVVSLHSAREVLVLSSPLFSGGSDVKWSAVDMSCHRLRRRLHRHSVREAFDPPLCLMILWALHHRVPYVCTLPLLRASFSHFYPPHLLLLLQLLHGTAHAILLPAPRGVCTAHLWTLCYCIGWGSTCDVTIIMMILRGKVCQHW